MMSQALVSIMMPCFNSRVGLPMALASLLCQTLRDWEAIVVDDGSTDRSCEVVEAVNDSRIKYIRLPENKGRGFARQVALDHAGGKFLAMLDADDWYYPTKLEMQVAYLEAQPGIALVSSEMAIVDGQCELVGLRRAVAALAGRDGATICLGPLPVAYPASMMRVHIAKRGRFDPALLRAQDLDFILQTCLGRPYASLPRALYAYSDFGPDMLEKALISHRFVRQAFSKHVQTNPVRARVLLLQSLAKSLCYRGIAAWNLGHLLVKQRAQTATANEYRAFSEARGLVSDRAKSITCRVDVPT